MLHSSLTRFTAQYFSFQTFTHLLCEYLCWLFFLSVWTLTINTDCTEEFDKLPLTYNMPRALPLCKQTVLCA